MLTAGADPLRDEGDEYARRLKEAGVAVTYRFFPGQFHGFFTMGKLLNQANIAATEISAWLKALVKQVFANAQITECSRVQDALSLVNGQRFTLDEPWSLLLLDDARVIHESTPILPLEPGGHRDTLVVTLRAGAFQGENGR